MNLLDFSALQAQELTRGPVVGLGGLEQAHLGFKLAREHHLFGGVPAHERLSADEAERFVRWLVDGGH